MMICKNGLILRTLYYESNYENYTSQWIADNACACVFGQWEIVRDQRYREPLYITIIIVSNGEKLGAQDILNSYHKRLTPRPFGPVCWLV